MITSIAIENFKGIGSRVTVPLKPITLLFGPNSAGKSTVLHAIHYAREVLEQRNLDADYTLSGGEFVDLGGFANLVHGHDLSKIVRIRFEMTFSERQDFAAAFPLFDDRYEVGLYVDPLCSEVKSGWVELAVRWSHTSNSPYVAEYEVGYEGQKLGAIQAVPDGRRVDLYMNLRHPSFKLPDGYEPSQEDATTVLEEMYPGAPLKVDPKALEAKPELREVVEFIETGAFGAAVIPVRSQWDAMPRLTEALSFQFAGDLKDHDAQRAEIFSTLLTRIFIGMGRALADELKSSRYVGPLRQTPQRNHQSPRSSDLSRWANGLAAWDMLTSATAGFVSRVSEWLDRLGTGYRIERRGFVEVGSDVAAFIKHAATRAIDSDERDWPELVRNWQSLLDQIGDAPERSRLFLVDAHRGMAIEPEDVGEGIAQIVPVIVAVLSTEARLITVEQPELHVHPRIQVGLGDLLIERMNFNKPSQDDPEGDEAVMLLETHSEHLMLRLLRRIRETAEGKLESPDQQLLKLVPAELGVLYVEHDGDGVRVQELRVDETGEFVDKWPQGFFSERGEELF